VIAWPWFRLGLVAFFAAYSLVTLATTLLLAVAYPLIVGTVGLAPAPVSLGFPDLAVFASSIVVAALNVIGIVRLRWSRLRAYQTFRLAVLVSIFFTQFFSFYIEQFAALLGLAFNVLTLEVIRYLIREETNKTLS
jgi:hypothetical protein